MKFFTDKNRSVTYDNKFRLMNVQKSANINKGHSVCVTCGKDMPICWDTVCFICGDTSCYDCSYENNYLWYCPKCKQKESQNETS